MKCIEDEIPFDVPINWCWARFGTITINRDSERKPVSSSKRNNVEKIYDYYGASGIIDKMDDYLFDEKLLLIGEDGANLITRSKPIAFFANGKYWVNNHAHCIDATTKELLDYICIYINAINLEKYVTGSAQPKMNQDNMNSILIPLPPIQEQKRIMDSINNTLNNINKVADEKDEIVTSIEKIKAKILDLAIRGKLVPQDQNDKPASVLLERIRGEKEELIKQGKIKRDKKESIIYKGDDNSYYEKIGNETKCIDEEIPFDIPENWTWCRLSHISEIIMGSSPSSTDICNDKQYIEFHQGKICFTDRTISCSGQYTKSITKIASPNSVLLCVRAPVGEVNITDRNICIGRGLASLKPYKEISEVFLFYWLQAFKSKLVEKATGTTFIAVTTEVVRDLIIPLPPYNSQISIIKAIEEVISQISQIEKSLS